MNWIIIIVVVAAGQNMNYVFQVTHFLSLVMKVFMQFLFPLCILRPAHQLSWFDQFYDTEWRVQVVKFSVRIFIIHLMLHIISYSSFMLLESCMLHKWWRTCGNRNETNGLLKYEVDSFSDVTALYSITVCVPPNFVVWGKGLAVRLLCCGWVYKNQKMWLRVHVFSKCFFVWLSILNICHIGRRFW